MQITIWQQWASNHSGFFWVVGIFETVDAAQTAYTEMREMLFEIDKWHREHREESAAAHRAGNIEPLPPEKEYAQKYSVMWPTTIDWSNWAGYGLQDYPGFEDFDAQKQAAELITRAVHIVGRNVVVGTPDQTWMTTQPFEGILAHLGAETIGYDFKFIESEASKGFGFFTRMSFTVPDSVVADRLEAAIRNYISGDLVASNNLPPWNNDAENYARVLPQSKLIKQEHIDTMMQEWQQRYLREIQLPPRSSASKAMPLERLALRNNHVNIERNGLHFTFDDLWFYNEELGVSAMIAWLEVNHCTDIDFRYVRLSGEDRAES
jgi:hypothetical protein